MDDDLFMEDAVTGASLNFGRPHAKLLNRKARCTKRVFFGIGIRRPGS